MGSRTIFKLRYSMFDKELEKTIKRTFFVLSDKPMTQVIDVITKKLYEASSDVADVVILTATELGSVEYDV